MPGRNRIALMTPLSSKHAIRFCLRAIFLRFLAKPSCKAGQPVEVLLLPIFAQSLPRFQKLFAHRKVSYIA